MGLEDILDTLYLNPYFIGKASEIHRSGDLPQATQLLEIRLLTSQISRPVS